MTFIVMRHAVLMEDEGRDAYVDSFDTKEKAQAWIAEQEGRYFSPLDYYICQSL